MAVIFALFAQFQLFHERMFASFATFINKKIRKL